MLDPVCKDPQGKGFGQGHGFLSRPAIDQNAGKVGDFGDPAPVVLPLDFHREAHTVRVTAGDPGVKEEEESLPPSSLL